MPGTGTPVATRDGLLAVLGGFRTQVWPVGACARGAVSRTFQIDLSLPQTAFRQISSTTDRAAAGQLRMVVYYGTIGAGASGSADAARPRPGVVHGGRCSLAGKGRS